MMNETTGCQLREVDLGRGLTGIVLENDALAVTVLPSKGADIFALVAKPENVDVMWHSPWGLQPQAAGTPAAFDSAVTWSDAYEGGWQVLFPNGGPAGNYKGVELNFHGEASTSAWDVDGQEASPERAELRLSARLRRSPFRIARRMWVAANDPVLHIAETVTNEGGEPMEFMWGHHPAYGAPFLGGACRIDTSAATIWEAARGEGDPRGAASARTHAWPTYDRGSGTRDLSRVPDEATPQSTMVFLRDFPGEHAWYGITNTDLGLGVGLVWPTEVFPFAWFWQEMHASAGFPWYRGVYTMAIEPFTSIPGGLLNVIEQTQTQRALAPGESLSVEFAAVLYRSSTGVAGIAPDGTVTARE